MSDKPRMGVVLAAGEASRFPNKLFMPAFDGGIVLQSSIRLLRSFECSPIVVVQSRDGLVRDVLHSVGERDLKFVTQPDPNGVVDAIQRASVLSDSNFYVAFGDNYYSHQEVPKISYTDRNYAVTRKIPDKLSPDLIKMWESLDVYNRAEMWCERAPFSSDKQNQRLAGWLCLCTRDVELVPATYSLWQLLLACQTRRVESTHPWYDLGTPEAYAYFTKIGRLDFSKEEVAQ